MPLSDLNLQELQALVNQEVEKSSPILNAQEVSPLGRLLAGFGSTPQGKTKILQNLGFEGILRDRPGSDSLNELFGDIGDVVSDVPEVVGGIAGTLGGVAMAPATGGSSIPLAAGLGTGAGAAVRQGIGNLLGSEEGFDVGDVAGSTAIGATGEKVLGGLLARLPAPLRKRAMTERIQKNVVEPGEALGISDVIPGGSLTESTAVGKAQLRAFQDAGPSGDLARSGPRRAFREAQQGVLEDAAQGVGVTSKAPVGSSDDLITAAKETLEQREALIGQQFDEARSAIPDPDNLPVVVSETEQALNRMAQRTEASALPDANITSGVRAQIKSLRDDVGNIRSFTQLDAFRRKVGDMLRSRDQMEALRATGADREFRDLYGALARDLNESIGEGQLAREFGGMNRGQIQPTGEAHGLRTQGGNPGARNVSQMEEGILGEGDLPTDPTLRGRLVATGSRSSNVPGQRRTSGELLDDLSGRVDKAQDLRETAAESFVDLLNLEDATIVRILKDPDQAESIFSRLFRRGSNATNIRRLKQKIGAEATEGGLPASPEGQEAWKNIQARIFRTVREDAEDLSQDILPGEARPFNGDAMRRSLDRLGGEDLLNEAIGKEATQTLYTLADFVKNADLEQRPFSSLSKADAKAVPLTFFEIALVRRAAQNMFDFALHRSGFPAQGGATQFLTEGFATGQGPQGILRSIGTTMGQLPGMAQEQFPAGKRAIRQPETIDEQVRRLLPPRTGIMNKVGA